MSVSTTATATVKLCAVEGCERPVRKRGWCGTHYQRWSRSGGPNGGDPLGSAPNARPRRGGVCLVPVCGLSNYALGLCRSHAHRAYAQSTGIPPEVAAEVVRRRDAHTYSPPDAPDAAPLRAFGLELREQRAGHVPFAVAWPVVVALIGSALDPWREALDFAMPERRAAYQGEPGHFASRRGRPACAPIVAVRVCFQQR